jgi:hypothetical protein
MITIEDVVGFVNKNKGQLLPTIGGRSHFAVENAGEKAFVFFTQANTRRNENHIWVGKSLLVFNETGSLKLRDYPHTQNGSYVLGLFWQIVVQQNGLQNLPAELPIDEKEINSADFTEQMELRKSRLGQGQYRQRLLRLRKSCYVTGISENALLRASHIKPWRDSNNVERLDHFNGLLLTPNYDALFDAGYISFRDDGCILISEHLSTGTIDALKINQQFLGADLGPRTKSYLAYHREKRFRI